MKTIIVTLIIVVNFSFSIIHSANSTEREFKYKKVDSVVTAVLYDEALIQREETLFPSGERIEMYLVYPELLLKIYKAESSSGKNDSCRKKGKFNGYGYAPGSCYDSFEEITSIVDDWLIENIEQYGVERSLCRYNTGKPIDDCDYLKKIK